MDPRHDTACPICDAPVGEQCRTIKARTPTSSHMKRYYQQMQNHRQRLAAGTEQRGADA